MKVVIWILFLITARKMKIDTVFSNSFGFGGTNATLVFRRLRD